jgi:hypothetical protein
MAVTDRIIAQTLETQQRIFRLSARDYGLTLKRISIDSNIPYATIRTYASGEAMMPIAALLKICDVIPDHLLSQLLDPVGRHLEVNEESDGDMDELGREAASFTAEYVNAKSDGIVTPFERSRLASRAGRLADAAGKVSAA